MTSGDGTAVLSIALGTMKSGSDRTRLVSGRITRESKSTSATTKIITKQRRHASSLPDINASPLTLTPTLSTRPHRPRLRPRQQTSCRGKIGTRGGRPAVHTLAWVLGGAVLLGWERGAPVGALGSNMNAMALVQHPAGLSVTTAENPGAWKVGTTSRAAGTVKGPTELKDGGTKLWGRWHERDDVECRNSNMIFPSGGLEMRGSNPLRKTARKFERVSSPREMSGGQGFSSSSALYPSEGIKKEQRTGKVFNKRHRRSRPFVEQRRVKATDAETEASAITEITKQKGAEHLNGSVDEPGEGKSDRGGIVRAVRMRKFLPPKRRHKKGNRKDKGALKGQVEVAEESEPLEASEAVDIEETGEVVQLSGAAAAREIVIAAAESSPWSNGEGKEKETGSGGEEAPTMARSAAGEEGNSKPRVRKCPPAVGFVSGFRDTRLDESAACSSSSGDEGVAVGVGKAGDGKSGPPGVEALIRALSEPLESAPQRCHSGSPALADNLSAPAAKGQSEGVAEAKPSSSRQKKTKPQSDASQLYSGAIEARIDEQSRIDPPAKSVSISFDPEADSPLSCITLNTDLFGEALHGPSVTNMSRTDVASYLEQWLLVAVKHGVAPRELRALLQETQGNTRDFGGGKMSGLGDIDVGVGRKDGVGRWAVAGTYHGSWDRGRWGDADAAGGSWTKYGWKRLNPPSAPHEEHETAEDCSSSCVDSDDETLAPSESEEEEMMETVAEALVGGGGGRLAEDWNIPIVAGSQETSESADSSAAASVSVPSDASTVADKDPPYLSSLEENAVPGVPVGASYDGGSEVRREEGKESSLLGLRVLEAVEARFKSGLHPPRIIAIGDVHGCLEELKDLVRKVEYWPGDLLLFLGDLVAKGPDSAGVVQLAKELGGVTVRGNHEFEVLRWLNVAAQENGRAPSHHHKIALSLSEEAGAWLKTSPWFFRCDDLGSLFVHAGFASGVNMNKQNPRMMMNMRSVSATGLITSKVLENSPWARHWTGPDTVFFGHDAERGLQLMDRAVGIDTGCVYGGRLTACILPERRLVSVASKAAYIAFGKRRGSDLSSPRKPANGGNGNGGNGNTKKSYGRHRSASPSNKPR